MSVSVRPLNIQLTLEKDKFLGLKNSDNRYIIHLNEFLNSIVNFK